MRLAEALEKLPLVDEPDAERGGSLAQGRDVVSIVLERRRSEDGEAARLLAELEQHPVPFAATDGVDAELVLQGGAERIARARPAFRFRISRAEVERGLDELALGMEHQPSALLVHPGQPEEVRVLPEVLGDASRIPLGGERGRAAFELFHDPGLALAVDRRRQRGRWLRIGMGKRGSGHERQEEG